MSEENVAVEGTPIPEGFGESFEGLNTLEDVVSAYKSAHSLAQSSIRIPGEDASDEDRAGFYEKITNVPGVTRLPNPEDEAAQAQFYNSLGRPSEATGYQVEMPEGFELNSDAILDFNEAAHKLGLTQDQYKGVMETYMNEKVEAHQAAAEYREQAEQTLRNRWGSEYDAKLESAKTVAGMYKEKYGADVDQLLEVAGNNPALLSMLAEVAPMFSEKGSIGGQTKHQFGMSPEEAQMKISEIMTNRDHAYWQGNADAVARVQKLYKIANPN